MKFRIPVTTGISSILLLLIATEVMSQSISGSSSATVGVVEPYSFFDDTYLTSPSWDIDGGASTWQSGSTYYANITFTTEGTKTIRFYDGSTLLASLEVSVGPCWAPNPSSSFTYASSTSGVTITRSSNPPSGYTWYWQTSTSGTSTSSSGTTYSATGGNTYYLRARDNNYLCWSSGYLATATIPSAPSLTNGLTCGPGPVTVSMSATAGSGGSSVRWYSATSGGSVLATGTSYGPSLSTTTTYYASTYNSTNGAEGLRYSVAATVQTRPTVGSASQAICSGTWTSIALTNSNSVTPAPTYSWTVSQSNTTGATDSTGGTIAQQLTATALEGTTTYTVTASSNGCAGASTNVIATVTAIPTITVTGPSTLVNGSPTQLSTNASYYSIQWKNAAGDISGQTASVYSVPIPSTYKVNARSSSGSAYCLSAGTVIGTALSSAGSVGLVSTTSIFKEGITNADALYLLKAEEVAQVNQYSDGLGRVFQTVATGAAPGPSKGDIVSHSGYGKDGLSDSTFLPYSTSTPSGALHRYAIRNSSNVYTSSEQYQFYQGTAKVASDTKPYAIASFRTAPDARVTSQGAPGTSWTGHEVTSLLTVNSSSYPVKYWKSDGTTSGNYSSKTVIVSITTDENGNKVRTYTNKLGQTVLKQVELDENINSVMTCWLDTYYVYDDYGQLKYQVPPKAVAILDGTPNLESDTDLAELIFKYTYDTRGRLIEKKEPGAAVKYMVYDIFDRLVLTQDGNLRSLNKWAYVKYDALGRTVYTGLYTNSRSRTNVQKWVDKAYTASSSTYPEANYVEYKESGADSLHGYSNVSFPKDSIFRLSVAYYDNYDFNKNGTPPYTYDAAHITGLPSTKKSNVRGMATGSKTRLLSVTGNVTANWIKGAVFYDTLDRVVQTQSNNHLDLNAVDKSSVLYNNIRRAVKTKLTHTAQSVTTHIGQWNVFDHAGRVLKTYHKINSDSVLVAQYEYNALGQLVDKKLHNTGGSNFLQSVDYRYNIRGWLKSINNSQLSNDSGTTNDETGDYFGMELAYNTSAGMSNPTYYNGNIGAIKWKTLGEAAGTAGQRSYSYSYDKSDKLKVATFKAYGTSAWDKEVNTLNESMKYDHGGNILALGRKKNSRGLSGTTITSSAAAIDTLTYTYTANTNRIDKVEDAATTEGFNNGAVNGTNEYTYNADGSQNKDSNKGISSITHNFLGKPQVITYTNGNKVEYVYNSAGIKLTMKFYEGATLKTCTNYSGGFVYEGSTPAMSYFSSPEGRVVKNGSNYEYQYAIADHQGNTRVLFSSSTPAPAAVTATFEGGSGDDAGQFSNVNTGNVINFTAANHTSGGIKVVRLNQSYKIGPSKSIKVYPGDKVDTEVWAYHENNDGYGTGIRTVGSMLASLATAFGGVSGGGGESGNIYNGLNSALNGFGLGGSAGDDAPSAYLNYILFDQNYKVLDMGWELVPSGAYFNKTLMSLDPITVKEAGFVFVYLSYEGTSNKYVQFDDFKVTHTKSNLIQASEYYPYGMQTANSWTRESNVDNNFLYNGGTELNKTTQVYDLYYRNYDPVLGRFGQVDPMASKYGPVSPYHFAGNNPVVMNDPMGDDFNGDNAYWDELVGTSYVANGRGWSVYRDFDALGRKTGARLMAQAMEAWEGMHRSQRMYDLLDLFEEVWNQTPDSPTGTSAGVFYIKDGQIDGYATWACNSGSATSEEQLMAGAVGMYPAWTHTLIIEAGLQGHLAGGNINSMIMGSLYADFGPGFQESDKAYMHAMVGIDQVKSKGLVEATKDSRAAMGAFLSQQGNLFIAHAMNGEFDEAYFALGMGGHAIMDSFSPAHANFQVWDPNDKRGGLEHLRREAWTLEGAATAALALREYTLHWVGLFYGH